MTVTDLRRAEQDEQALEHRRFRYLPGLDGLRGIAVIFMLLYHLDVSWTGDGGPVALEMFFVISGYLITSLFIIEKHNTDRISIPGFWVRRTRRLVPALVAMFALITVWASLPGPFGPSAIEKGQMRGDGLSSAAYVSNWWFIFSGQSYFERFAAPSPFRHTWSLAVEEQFYLLVAMVVALGFAVWGVDRKRWAWLAGAGAVASLAWMAFLTRMGDLTAEGLWPLGIDPESLPGWLRTFLNFQGTGDPSRVYYGTDTRLHAVLAGVCLAFVLERIDLRKVSQRSLELIALVSFGALMALLLFTPKHSHWLYYGGYGLVDVLTCLAIVGVAAPRPTAVGAGLSWRPLAFVGVLSYSLYVFHWPIFVILSEDRVPFRGWQLDVVRMVVSCAVAYASYRFYEDPMRRKGLGRTDRRVAAVLVIVAILATFVFATRGGTDTVELPAEAAEVPPVTGTPTVIVAGDSMAYTYGGFVGSQAVDKETGFQVRTAAAIGCGIVDADYRIDGRPQKQNDACPGWPDRWKERVDDLEPDASLLLAWGWELYDRRVPGPDGEMVELPAGSPQWRAQLGEAVDRAIDVLSARGGKVALVTMPCIDPDADTPRHPTTKDTTDPSRVQAVNEVLREAAERNATKGVSLIDLNAYLCEGNRYRAHIDGQLISDDGIHFTRAGAGLVWRWMAPQVAEIIGTP